MFEKWPGLKVNQGKTQVTVFKVKFRKPDLVEVLNLKWCIEFKLLGIYFDSDLKHMEKNTILHLTRS